jgi:hypothetical protein
MLSRSDDFGKGRAEEKMRIFGRPKKSSDSMLDAYKNTAILLSRPVSLGQMGLDQGHNLQAFGFCRRLGVRSVTNTG